MDPGVLKAIAATFGPVTAGAIQQLLSNGGDSDVFMQAGGDLSAPGTLVGQLSPTVLFFFLFAVLFIVVVVALFAFIQSWMTSNRVNSVTRAETDEIKSIYRQDIRDIIDQHEKQSETYRKMAEMRTGKEVYQTTEQGTQALRPDESK